MLFSPRTPENRVVIYAIDLDSICTQSACVMLLICETKQARDVLPGLFLGCL